ncbi:hypothetical protein ANANG_G00158960 [Anguilla anguilla]|uniref:Uncharacterized protein n=1 Tax=Anguilla anguilla TaxID=7936 RepID=A0A9D3RYR8_ANGAN|nr:hypothetical protein ANANG_G00158960 [Anguilla anguilla]
MAVNPGPINQMVVLSAGPKERKMAEGLKSNLYKGVSGDLPDLSILRVSEVYNSFSSDVAPLITTMRISSEVPLVDSIFGKVQEGSVLSYQLPAARSHKTSPHTNAPPRPPLPLEGYHLEPAGCSFVLSEHQQLHMNSLATPHDMAHKIDMATPEQSSSGVASLMKATDHIITVQRNLPCQRADIC